MSQEFNSLNNSGVVKAPAGRCSCGGTRHIYRLPRRLDIDILPYIEPFGKPAFDFETTRLLKIENKKYVLTGVRRLKEIRFVLKDADAASELERFENILASYIEDTKGTK